MNNKIDPDYAVAKGACLHAWKLLQAGGEVYASEDYSDVTS